VEIIKDPVLETYGINYLPRFTDGFEKIIELAREKISPFSKESVSSYTVYFIVKGEEAEGGFDCCDNEKCIKETKLDIRNVYGKGTHVEDVLYPNDGDHESIERCCQCGTPLNEFLTWCEKELDFLEDNKWNEKFIKDEGFLISGILVSSPTLDFDISEYAKHQGGEILKDALIDREEFFQRIVKLAQYIIEKI
jgi:hypothetical protein